MADLLFKLLPVLLAQLLFFVTTNSVFKSSLEPAFCDSGETWETKAFLQRGRWSTWQGAQFGLGKAL